MPVMSPDAAPRPRGVDPSPALSCEGFDERSEEPRVALLVLDTGRVPSLQNVVRDILHHVPGARVHLGEIASAVRAPAEATRTADATHPDLCDRAAAWRRLFTEVPADIYLLIGGRCEAHLAPRLLHEIRAGLDLVGVARPGGPDGRPGQLASALARWAAHFLYGSGAGALLLQDDAGLWACSRRYAESFLQASRESGPAAAFARHALRLRMPVGILEPQQRSASRERIGAAVATGTLPGVAASVALVIRLLIEERPRRALGVLGLGLVAAGLATALPGLEVEAWHARLPPSPAVLLALVLVSSGAATMAVGTALDAVVHARQEVRRLGRLAMQSRGEPG